MVGVRFLAPPTVFLASRLTGHAAAFSPSSSKVWDAVPTSNASYTRKNISITRGGARNLSSVLLSASPLEVIEPSYNLAIGSLALGAVFGVPGSPLKSKVSAFLGGIPLLAFGLFLAFQTTTLRFTFDENNFSLVKSDMSSMGENVVVGGENVWSYSSFVNYDFFPSRQFPILVYFKETQTPEDMWNVGPGEQANSPEAISKGAKPGQVHFFPAIGNVEQIANAFESNKCSKI
mmetsp:Transcript_19115/g.43516  ORF Transcript_19115/g.43516 Transcript_19115/m.43516 type:complete len:233 (-) Transcript_19115:122-820(-)|eukprot:CAMPEP_0113315084 /NCGR_PEP_ID=MMETSP0010_2-20120614/10898_1 /TAXON_ID=216773 ORGANISM="Corethron hystrix, Strain 308" /NCGR_SAMPLE_ID=MMETSP0010_2 /ASSEMBLY_ACC=CAM_ASM_000155 /LENGTH=232 /DNA_ID=CAMNT_0000171523 /DNA_START=39 /DNA_END=737 /DNA_ORIENTATION=- /assembly_acc=CAM_ASM_000155